MTYKCGVTVPLVPYLPVYNAHFFLTNFASKIEKRIYTEPFVFMLGNLHNNTKSAKSNSFQFYATSRNKSRQKVCLALYITSVHVRQWQISHATCLRSRLKNLLHFLQYFDDKVSSMKNFPFRLCRSTIHSLIFWFLEQMQKDLKEKRSCKSPLQSHLNLFMWQQV